MSPEILDLVNEVGQIVRRCSKPFGGIQVIFVGDFYQLPPVRKHKDGEDEFTASDKEFAFESNTWKEMNPKVCVLDEIVRQSDPEFQEILLEARKGGALSDKAIRLLQARQREDWKEQTIKPTLLFTRRFEVDLINNRNLEALPKESRVIYKAHTTTTDKFPARLTLKDPQVQRAISKLDLNAPYQDELELRIGAQVMLVYNTNVEEKLVNGSRGVITGFTDSLPKLPIVHFHGHTAPTKVGEISWESEEIEGLRRVQIPLVCAWAITIHKSQGATLDSALIDIGASTFEKGQAYVALSRVRSLDSLWIWDLDPEAFKSHPKVRTFYENLSA
jgi:ATP-dependent DNA helicase PIF1